MDAGTLVGLLIAAGVAYFVYQDALMRGWESGSAILMGVGVLLLLIIFLPIYLFIKNNPGRTKVALAANRAIARQSNHGNKDIVLDSSEIAKEVGIAQVSIVRQMLFQSITKGEIPSGIRII